MFRSLLTTAILSCLLVACSSANFGGKSSRGQTSADAGPPAADAPANPVEPSKPISPFPALQDCESAAPTRVCGLASLKPNLQNVAALGNAQTLAGIRLPKGNHNQQAVQDLTLDGSCLSENSFIDGQWDRSVFQGSEMIITELSRTKWTSARFIDSDLRLSHFALADFKGLEVKNSCLASINWSASQMQDVTIENSFAERGNFSALKSVGTFAFKGGSLNRANLSGAVFEGAVSFRDVDMRGADLSAVQFKGAVDWQGTQLGGATWMDGRTCAEGSVGACN